MTPEQKQEITKLMDEYGVLWTSLPPNSTYETYKELIALIAETQGEITDEVLEKARNAPMDEGYTP